MDGSIDTHMIYLNFMGDMWILHDYLNAILLKYDRKTKYLLLMLDIKI